MRQAYRWVSRVLVVMVVMVVSACGKATVDRDPADTTLIVPEATQGTIADQVVGPDEPEVVFRAAVSYLDEVIPPCVPLEGTSLDPCPRTTPGQVAVLSVRPAPPSWPHTDDLPTITDTMMGFDPITITHIVVRATVQDNTTRCGLYPLIMADHSEVSFSSSYYRYNCYVDVRVNEYIVGTGPSELTVELHREGLNLSEELLADWIIGKDDWLIDIVYDPEARTAAVYEGNEVVLFLLPSFTIAVESWEGGTAIADVWFVQRPDEGAIRAVAPDIVEALTEDQRNKLDMPLADLVTKIKAAATARDNEYDGRIGEDSDLPDLITDANRLRDFFGRVGRRLQWPRQDNRTPPSGRTTGDTHQRCYDPGREQLVDNVGCRGDGRRSIPILSPV